MLKFFVKDLRAHLGKFGLVLTDELSVYLNGKTFKIKDIGMVAIWEVNTDGDVNGYTGGVQGFVHFLKKDLKAEGFDFYKVYDWKLEDSCVFK